jgi:hypothetical protein
MHFQNVVDNSYYLCVMGFKLVHLSNVPHKDQQSIIYFLELAVSRLISSNEIECWLALSRNWKVGPLSTHVCRWTKFFDSR